MRSVLLFLGRRALVAAAALATAAALHAALDPATPPSARAVASIPALSDLR